MQQLAILNTRDIKIIRERVQAQFGYFLEEGYAYLKNNQYKLFVVTKDISRLPLKNLIIDKLGLYFAETMRNGEVRLSKEGAQLLAAEAQKNKITLKNAVSLTSEELKEYFKGNDLDKDLGGESRMLLLFYHEDCFGCAKYKEGKILNFLPKIHRGEVIV